ncbi:MAG: hypothetical protein ACYTGL_30550 [Planctomycetota bacterium]|jgi:gluconolactonase
MMSRLSLAANRAGFHESACRIAPTPEQPLLDLFTKDFDMRSILSLLLLACVAGAMAPSVVSAEEKKAEAKLVKVTARDIALEVPVSWKEEKPKSRLRLTQFALPKAEGDTEKTELAVFVFPGGGTIEQNLPRWVREFDPQGLKVKTTKGTSSQGPYVVGDLSGTHRGSSFARRPKPLQNGRIIGIILMPEGKPYYYLKVTGPNKSVEAAAKALRRSIGADVEKEEKLEVGA